jgi:hypothetical protein
MHAERESAVEIAGPGILVSLAQPASFEAASQSTHRDLLPVLRARPSLVLTVCRRPAHLICNSGELLRCGKGTLACVFPRGPEPKNLLLNGQQEHSEWERRFSVSITVQDGCRLLQNLLSADSTERKTTMLKNADPLEDEIEEQTSFTDTSELPKHSQWDSFVLTLKLIGIALTILGAIWGIEILQNQ